MDQEVIIMTQTETTENKCERLVSFLKLQPDYVTPIPNTPYPVGLRRWLRVLNEADYIF